MSDEDFEREEQEADVVDRLTSYAQELHEDFDWTLDDIVAHIRAVIGRTG